MENMPMQNPVQTPMYKPEEPLNKNLVLICVTVVVVCLIISVAVVLYPKLVGTGTTVNNPVINNQPTPTPTGPVAISIDDDAVLGSANAPVTMIEFSDYECPFCKRHFTDVYPQIKKDYIDTGKVKFVFRDFIAVPSHNPLATSEAMAAQCAKDQGGDAAYFKYHDALFAKTTSNGNGIALNQLAVIAKDLGLNATTFQSCLDSNKFSSEVAKDNADGGNAGVNGTPSFFIGKSTSSGVIQGNLIVGAQPYSAFKTALDNALAN